MHNDGDSGLFNDSTQYSAGQLRQGDVERLLVLGGDALHMQGAIVTLRYIHIIYMELSGSYINHHVKYCVIQ